MQVRILDFEEATSKFRWLKQILFCFFRAMRLRGCVCHMFKFRARGDTLSAGQTKAIATAGNITLMFV